MYVDTPVSNARSIMGDSMMDHAREEFHASSRPKTATSARFRSMSMSLPWKRRQSFLDVESEVVGDFREMAIDESHASSQSHGSKSGAGVKGTLRRASLTLKGIVRPTTRRSSVPAQQHEDSRDESRPTTSHSTWHRLRQAASFRNMRPIYAGRGGLETINSPLESHFHDVPVPGNGSEPPIIPQHTGAAAKAAAAAAAMQNEWAFARQQQYLSPYDSQEDVESGIGIAVTTPEVDAASLDFNNTSISRVDFISQLPIELAIQMLSYLDATGLATASRVSKAWNGVVRDQQIWRQSFLREKTRTYATSMPVQPGTGFGIPPVRPNNDWRSIYRAKQQLDSRWKKGHVRPVYLNGHLDSIYCLQFDETKIITGSRDKTIRIWDMHTFECKLVIGPPEVVNSPGLLIDVEGNLVHYASSPESYRANTSMPKAVHFPIHHKASILCLQYDDEMLVTGSSDSTCIVYDIKAGYRPIRRLNGHTAAVLDLAFDKKHIVTCSKDVTICVWDRQTGDLIKQLRGHSGPVNAIQLRDNTIVSCSGDFSVRLWNIDSGKNIREFTGHTKGLACSQFSQDGKYVASAGNDKVINIWDASSGERVREMKAHESLVRSLHIDSVSGRLVSGSYDTDIKVFDMETGRQLLDFPRWHASWVLSAKSDYRRIVSTGQDPKILVMDFGAGVEGVELLESCSSRALELRDPVDGEIIEGYI